MKKMLAILMALLMAALLLPAYAEEGDVAEIAEIAGTVLEIGEEFILLETPEGQLIEAILTADTIREGKEIAEGDFIHVMYNGQMTRSYPAPGDGAAHWLLRPHGYGQRHHRRGLHPHHR